MTTTKTTTNNYNN